MHDILCTNIAISIYFNKCDGGSVAYQYSHVCYILIYYSLHKVTVWSEITCGMWRFDDPYHFQHHDLIQGMKGHDIMQMLEHNQRLECPDKCPQPIYELMLRCWSWRCVYALLYCCV